MKLDQKNLKRSWAQAQLEFKRGPDRVGRNPRPGPDRTTSFLLSFFFFFPASSSSSSSGKSEQTQALNSLLSLSRRLRLLSLPSDRSLSRLSPFRSPLRPPRAERRPSLLQTHLPCACCLRPSLRDLRPGPPLVAVPSTDPGEPASAPTKLYDSDWSPAESHQRQDAPVPGQPTAAPTSIRGRWAKLDSYLGLGLGIGL
jgi:hypothetical protein